MLVCSICPFFVRVGHFFHVDFSYAFGADPKPLPPPMKVCREMVEAMGGVHGPPYKRFKTTCFTAFSLARQYIAGPLLAAISLAGQYVEGSEDCSWTVESATRHVKKLDSTQLTKVSHFVF